MHITKLEERVHLSTWSVANSICQTKLGPRSTCNWSQVNYVNSVPIKVKKYEKKFSAWSHGGLRTELTWDQTGFGWS